ncbi:MAG: glycosyltransferase family 4 protein [Candidatus Pacebacteria bacterium]|nr:glycosyltransferase family 4 protein [Candidatus Paceibacterota bacterium]
MPTEKAHGYQIAKMCEEFGKKIETELIITARKSHIKENIFEYYGLEKTFKIKKVGSFDSFKWERFLGRIAWQIQKVLFGWQIKKIKIGKEDIVYTREAEIASIMIKKGNKVFYEGHNWPKKDKIHLEMLKKTKGIICITKGLAERYIEKGIKKEKILVAPDGVDLEKFLAVNHLSKEKARKELKLPENRKIAVYVGSFYKWKGIDVLLKAAEKMREVIFVVAGSGKIEKELPENVKMVGKKLKTEVPKWLLAADVLILPNSGKEDISRLYTSPLKMFEYMASGRPIVASDLPSIREVLNENNAVLVEPDKEESLILGIKKVLENEEMVLNIARRALDDVKKYDWKRRAENILEFIGVNFK